MPVLAIFFYAAILGLIHYHFTKNSEISLSDEGYLWYGAICLLDKQIPIRDFRAYDPGRYLWTGLFLKIFGSNIRNVRLSMATVLFVSIFILELFLLQAEYNPIFLVLAPIIILFWLNPVYKIIDCAIPLISILLFAYSFTSETTVDLYFIGVWIGLSSFIGLNHFIYNGAGIITILILSIVKSGMGIFAASLLPILVGVIIGLTPMILFLCMPGVFKAYYKRKIYRIFKRGSSNLKISFPKFWREKLMAGTTLNPKFILGLTVFLMPFFFLLNIVYQMVGSQDLNYFILCSNIIGLFYLNHFYSRIDIGHLVISFIPFIISTIASAQHNLLLFWIQLLIIIILTLLLIYKRFIQGIYFSNKSQQTLEYRDIVVKGTPEYIKRLDRILQKIEAHVREADTVFFAPACVGLYPILNKKSYIYDTFPVYPGTEEEQEDMIFQVKKEQIDFIFIHNFPLDQKESLKFEHTHDKVWKYIIGNYTRLPSKPLNDNHFFFIKNSP